jgi:hypothetical protein
MTCVQKTDRSVLRQDEVGLLMRCPGQDLRFWKLGDIFEAPCPHCGTEIEFWKDEPSVKCPQCRRVIVNPRLDLGCAQWCQHAEQCLGALIDPQSLLCKKLIKEMKTALGQDEHKINHSLAVFRHAQQILAEAAADARMVNAAAILHLVGGSCREAEPPSAQASQTDGDLSRVREILARCDVDAEQAEHICRLVADHRHHKAENSPEAKILGDAERLARLADSDADTQRLEAREFVLHRMQTSKGRELAGAFIGSGGKPPGPRG